MPLWLPDSEASECYECGVSFSTLRRRHHCRQCGLIFCGTCCSLCSLSQQAGEETTLRLCLSCFQQRERQIHILNPLCQQQRELDCMIEWAQGSASTSVPSQGPRLLAPPSDSSNSSRSLGTIKEGPLGAPPSGLPNGICALYLLRESVAAHCLLEGLPSPAAAVLLHLAASCVSAIQLSPSAALSLGDAVHICCIKGRDIRDSVSLSGVAFPFIMHYKQQQQLLPLRQGRVLLLAGDIDVKENGAAPLSPRESGLLRLEVERKRQSLATEMTLQQLSLLRPHVLLLSGGVSLSLLQRLTDLRIVVIPSVSLSILKRASRATGAPLWASLGVAAGALAQHQKTLGICSLEWRSPIPGAPPHIILSECPPFRFCTICLVLPSIEAAAATTTTAAAAAVAGAASEAAAPATEMQEIRRYKKVLWRALWAAFALQQELRFVAACCCPGEGPPGPSWVQRASERLLLLPPPERWGPWAAGGPLGPQGDRDAAAGEEGRETFGSNNAGAAEQQQHPQQQQPCSNSSSNSNGVSAEVSQLLEIGFKGRPLGSWLRSCCTSLGCGGPLELQHRLLQCLYTSLSPTGPREEPLRAAAAAASAQATTSSNIAAAAAMQLLALADGEMPQDGTIGLPAHPPEDPGSPKGLHGGPTGGPPPALVQHLAAASAVGETPAPPAATAAATAALATAATAAAGDCIGRRLLNVAFSLDAQGPSFGISWSCRLQQCGSAGGGPGGPPSCCPSVLSFCLFGSTLREVAEGWCLFLQQNPAARRCPAGDPRCKRPLVEHLLSLSRGTNRVIVDFNVSS